MNAPHPIRQWGRIASSCPPNIWQVHLIWKTNIKQGTSRSFHDRLLELSPLLDQVEAVQDRERMSCRTPRCTVPENFDLPLFLHIEEGHKEPISGYLRCTAPPTFSITSRATWGEEVGVRTGAWTPTGRPQTWRCCSAPGGGPWPWLIWTAPSTSLPYIWKLYLSAKKWGTVTVIPPLTNWLAVINSIRFHPISNEELVFPEQLRLEMWRAVLA